MSLTLGCEINRHEACNPQFRGNTCPCVCHQRRRPHLASPPLPAGFAIKPPADAVELQLRRMGVK